jgi:predicted transcriptional regulator
MTVPDRMRNERGRFEPTYADEEFLTAVRANAPATTQEVADAVGVVRQSADYRLKNLETANEVTSKKVGPSMVWMLDDRKTTEARA